MHPGDLRKPDQSFKTISTAWKHEKHRRLECARKTEAGCKDARMHQGTLRKSNIPCEISGFIRYVQDLVSGINALKQSRGIKKCFEALEEHSKPFRSIAKTVRWVK
jgi:hypothetical protein